MIAAYFVNREEKLLMLIMSAGKENAMVKRENQEFSKRII